MIQPSREKWYNMRYARKETIMADAFSFVPFKREDHIYHNEAFAELCKDAVRAFNGTPVCELPPPRFTGSGVYAIYCTAKKGIYERYGNKVNRMGYNVPIYVGKAVPKGWRQSRTAGVETDNGSALRSRLVHHSKTILAVDNLKLADFACRFMIFSGSSVYMISAVEAALIAEYTPLWNAVIDGFGNNDPGGKRMGGIVPKWHILHKGVKWALRMTGPRVDVRKVQKSVMDYMMGLR